MTIYAKALPPDTTSNIAGGQWHPSAISREAVTPEWRAPVLAALDYSWRRFQIMVGDDYGIRWLPTYAETGGGLGPPISDLPAVNRMLAPDEHPFPVDNVAATTRSMSRPAASSAR